MHPSNAQLDAYFTRKLAANERLSVDEHLRSCARCRAYVTALSDATDPVAAPLSRDPLIGSMLSGYRVLDWLGKGGMGALYRGEQPVIGKQVAIKVMLADGAGNPTLVERMIREARAVNEIRHGNIVDIFAFGQLPDGRPYLVMELLEGQSLAEVVAEKGALPPQRVLAVLAQAMAALAAAHAVGVVHRDLKPDNIFCDARAEPWKITLLDFGLARSQRSTSITQPGAVMGTPSYMSPEQIRGAQNVTEKTDVYAMGVVAWTLLVGREPYGTDGALDVMRRHLAMPVPRLHDVVPGLPSAFEALVLRMMDKDPAQRPTAAEVCAELEALGAPAVREATPASAAPRSPWRLALPMVGASFVAALVAVALFSSSQAPTPVPQVATPVPRPPPAPPSGPEPAPLPLPEPTPRVVEAVRWVGMPCASVVRVNEIRHNFTGDLVYVFLDGAGTDTLTITTTDSKANVKQLEKLRKRIEACRDTPQVLVADPVYDRPGNKSLVARDNFLNRTNGPEADIRNVRFEAPDGGR